MSHGHSAKLLREFIASRGCTRSSTAAYASHALVSTSRRSYKPQRKAGEVQAAAANSPDERAVAPAKVTAIPRNLTISANLSLLRLAVHPVLSPPSLSVEQRRHETTGTTPTYMEDMETTDEYELMDGLYSKITKRIEASDLPPSVRALKSAVEDSKLTAVNSEQAWDLLVIIEKKGVAGKIPLTVLMRTARILCLNLHRNLLSSPLKEPSQADDRTIANRLHHILDLVEPHSDAGFGRHALRASAYAAQRQFDQAGDSARKLVDHEEAQTSITSMRSLAHVIDAMTTNGHLEKARQLAIDLWPVTYKHICNFGRGPSSMYEGLRKVGNKLRGRVFRALESIPKPALWLQERWKSTSPETLSEVVQLLMAFCYAAERPLDGLAIFQLVAVARENDYVHLRSFQLFQLARSLISFGYYNEAEVVLEHVADRRNTTAKQLDYLQVGLQLCAARGNVTGAEDCFGQLSDAGKVSDTDRQLLMHAYAKAGDTVSLTQKWDGFYAHKRKPSILSFEEMVFGFANKGDMEGIDKWLGEMPKYGHRPTTGIYNNILKVFAARNDIDSASLVLKQMRSTGVTVDSITYTLLLSILAKRADPLAAERLMRLIDAEGLQPSPSVLNTLMNTHVEAGSWKGVVRVFDYIEVERRKSGRSYSIDVFNILLKACVRIGAPFSVVANYWQKLETIGLKPDKYTWCLLVQSACDAGRMDIAHDVFTELDKLSAEMNDSSHINVYVLTIIMSGFLKAGDKVQAKAIYDEMITRGIQPTSATYANIVKAYAIEGTEESLRLAEEFITSLLNDESPNKMAWTVPAGNVATPYESIFVPLMHAYGRAIRPEEVERLYNTMLDGGGDSSVVFLTLLLDAHRRSGNIETVQEVWPQLFERAREASSTTFLANSPDSDTPGKAIPRRQGNMLCVALSIYIDALSKAGLHVEIADAWKKTRDAGFAFDPSNWNHLCTALVRAGEVIRAFEVVERVILPYHENLRKAKRDRDRNPKDVFIFGDQSSSDLQSGQPESQFVDRPDTQTESRQPARQRQATFLTREQPDLLTAEVDKALPYPYAFQEALVGGDDDEEGADVDFAQPLHMLQQLFPSWGMWRPHNTTLAHLAWAVGKLESGRLARPQPSQRKGEGRDPYKVKSDQDESDLDKEMMDAHAMLISIQERFPNTMASIRRWRYSRNARKLYITASLQ